MVSFVLCKLYCSKDIIKQSEYSLYFLYALVKVSKGLCILKLRTKQINNIISARVISQG